MLQKLFRTGKQQSAHIFINVLGTNNGGIELAVEYPIKIRDLSLHFPNSKQITAAFDSLNIDTVFKKYPAIHRVLL